MYRCGGVACTGVLCRPDPVLASEDHQACAHVQSWGTFTPSHSTRPTKLAASQTPMTFALRPVFSFRRLNVISLDAHHRNLTSRWPMTTSSCRTWFAVPRDLADHPNPRTRGCPSRPAGCILVKPHCWGLNVRHQASSAIQRWRGRFYYCSGVIARSLGRMSPAGATGPTGQSWQAVDRESKNGKLPRYWACCAH